MVQRTKEQLAMAIAKDVKKQLLAKRLRLKRGSYLATSSSIGGEICRAGGDLQKHLPELQPACTVCALGSLLLSKARIADQVPIKALEDDSFYGTRLEPCRSAVVEHLEDAFDWSALAVIECLFEGVDVVGLPMVVSRDRAKAINKRLRYPRIIMLAICDNIIKYKGVFNFDALEKAVMKPRKRKLAVAPT